MHLYCFRHPPSARHRRRCGNKCVLHQRLLSFASILCGEKRFSIGLDLDMNITDSHQHAANRNNCAIVANCSIFLAPRLLHIFSLTHTHTNIYCHFAFLKEKKSCLFSSLRCLHVAYDMRLSVLICRIYLIDMKVDWHTEKRHSYSLSGIFVLKTKIKCYFLSVFPSKMSRVCMLIIWEKKKNLPHIYSAYVEQTAEMNDVYGCRNAVCSSSN